MCQRERSTGGNRSCRASGRRRLAPARRSAGGHRRPAAERHEAFQSGRAILPLLGYYYSWRRVHIHIELGGVRPLGTGKAQSVGVPGPTPNTGSDMVIHVHAVDVHCYPHVTVCRRTLASTIHVAPEPCTGAGIVHRGDLCELDGLVAWGGCRVFG